MNENRKYNEKCGEKKSWFFILFRTNEGHNSLIEILIEIDSRRKKNKKRKKYIYCVC